MAINSGFLEGLGAGLSEIGGSVFKAKVLDKLREEEDVRKEERKAAREAKEVKETKLEDLGGGKWVRRSYNANGDMIKEEAAAANDILAAENAARKEKLGLENLLLTQQKAQKDLDTYDEDRALDMRYKNAQIKRAEADALYDLGLGRQPGRGGKADEPKSFEDSVDEFVKDNKALFDEYVKGKDDEENRFMSASEFRNVAREAVRAAAERRKDPRSFFSEHLRLYVNDKRSPYQKRRALDQ
jgi:hypothetical protein